MRNSLKKYALDYLKLRYPDFVEGYVMEDLAKGYGYLASNIGRRLRELEKAGVVKTEYYKGTRGESLAKYRYILPQDAKEKEKFLKETNRLRVDIVTLPSGERVARETIV